MIAPDLTKWSPDYRQGRPSKNIVIIHSTRSGVRPYYELEYQATINWLTGPSGLSIHWVVGRNPNEKARLVRDDCQAFHAGEHNYEAWGIEVCQSMPNDNYGDEQLAQLVQICKGYVADFGVASIHTLSMSQSGFIGHEETPQGKRAGKSDPGNPFPWERFISMLQGGAPIPAPIGDDDEMKSHHAWATWFQAEDNGNAGRSVAGSENIYVVQARSDFRLPADALAVLCDVEFYEGDAEFIHGGTDIPAAKQGANSFIANLAGDGTMNFRTRGGCRFRNLHCVGYFR